MELQILEDIIQKLTIEKRWYVVVLCRVNTLLLHKYRINSTQLFNLHAVQFQTENGEGNETNHRWEHCSISSFVFRFSSYASILYFQVIYVAKWINWELEQNQPSHKPSENFTLQFPGVGIVKRTSSSQLIPAKTNKLAVFLLNGMFMYIYKMLFIYCSIHWENTRNFGLSGYFEFSEREPFSDSFSIRSPIQKGLLLFSASTPSLPLRVDSSIIEKQVLLRNAQSHSSPFFRSEFHFKNSVWVFNSIKTQRKNTRIIQSLSPFYYLYQIKYIVPSWKLYKYCLHRIVLTSCVIISTLHSFSQSLCLDWKEFF